MRKKSPLDNCCLKFKYLPPIRCNETIYNKLSISVFEKEVEFTSECDPWPFSWLRWPSFKKFWVYTNKFYSYFKSTTIKKQLNRAKFEKKYLDLDLQVRVVMDEFKDTNGQPGNNPNYFMRDIFCKSTSLMRVMLANKVLYNRGNGQGS